MEIRKRNMIYILGIICVMCITSIILSGCGKRWWYGWDDSYVYISEEPYIYMPLDKGKVIIELDGEKKNVETGWENDGTKIYFYQGGKREIESVDLIWEAEVLKFKKDKLYLKIVKDNCGNDEGKEIVLEKRLKEE